MGLFQLRITPTEYRTTIKSHGFFDLCTFVVGQNNLMCTLPYKTQKGEGIFQTFLQNNEVLCNVISGNEELACQIAANCLSLDIDLNKLYFLIAGHSDYEWFIKCGFGRYFRSPTLYEDCIKLISTANTNWKNTVKIVRSLTEYYGQEVNGVKAFPEPSQLVKISESDLKTNTKCGYRAKSFIDIAAKATEDPNFFLGEDWKSLQPNSFFNRLLTIHGMGPGSASYLCRIYGKPHIYSIDSWVVKRCDELWGLNFRVTDKNGKIKPDFKKYEDYLKKRYENFKEYGPSVCWFEITRYWHNNDKWEGLWWN